MKIFITGSESFVGKNLIKKFIKNSIDVYGIDLVSKSNLDYEYHQIDINNENISDIIPESCDAIIHLAALSRDPDCKNKAHECFNINVMGTLNLIKAAIKKKSKQFIFASSEWVYENFENNQEKNEEHFIDITKHSSEYALSKLISESNLRQQFENGFCPVTILRFGIIYGPRENNWSAVESIFNQVRNNESVSVGSLKSGRRFVHVDDICNGIIKSIGLNGFEIINLTADRVISLDDIMTESQKILKKNIEIIENDPKQISIRNPSNEKAKKILKWNPEIDIKNGLRTLL